MTKNNRFIFREATHGDISGMQVVRNAVKENRLSDPALVKDKDVEDYIMRRGKGWVCEADGKVAGFAIVSVFDKNVWALFVDPGFEKMGVGRRLHDIMMEWYFSKTEDIIWLSTAPGTRADFFYRKAGWQLRGTTENGELRFEMSNSNWETSRKSAG